MAGDCPRIDVGRNSRLAGIPTMSALRWAIASAATMRQNVRTSLRIGAVATLCERLSPSAVAILVIATAALSRTAGLVPLVLLPPARVDGASSSVGRPTRDALWAAGAWTIVIVAAGAILAGIDPLGLILMVLPTATVSWMMTRLSDRLIGGQTGDVAGATQQLSEITAYIGLLLTIEP